MKKKLTGRVRLLRLRRTPSGALFFLALLAREYGRSRWGRRGGERLQRVRRCGRGRRSAPATPPARQPAAPSTRALPPHATPPAQVAPEFNQKDSILFVVDARKAMCEPTPDGSPTCFSKVCQHTAIVSPDRVG